MRPTEKTPKEASKSAKIPVSSEEHRKWLCHYFTRHAMIAASAYSCNRTTRQT
jgi:hypothetical protein